MDILKKNAVKTLNESSNEQNINERRSFIKKAVYVAPTLVAMGSLMKPKNASAGGDNPPSSPPDPWG